jgi:hypothetical protein
VVGFWPVINAELVPPALPTPSSMLGSPGEGVGGRSRGKGGPVGLRSALVAPQWDASGGAQLQRWQQGRGVWL